MFNAQVSATKGLGDAPARFQSPDSVVPLLAFGLSNSVLVSEKPSVTDRL